MSVISERGKMPPARRFPPISETALQDAIVDCARKLRWRLVYHTFDSRRSEEGFPDLVLARAPRLIFAELKVKGNEPTDAQRAWLEELELVGAYPFGAAVEVYLWREDDWSSGRVADVLRGA